MSKKPIIFDNIPQIAKISHELRNPIHGIHGICGVLRDNWQLFDDSAKKSSIDKIYEATAELKDLVEKLFTLNGNTIIYNFAQENIVAVVQKAMDKSKLFAVDKNFPNIFLECKNEEIYINVDSFWIGQVLANLIVNATKHSKGRNIKLKIDSDEKEIIVSVIDDGVGVPKNELDFIFAPFNQSSITDLSNKGSGLGLAICQQVIAAHNGRIWAENNQEKGLNISFTVARN